jgi:hypothetical protein
MPDRQSIEDFAAKLPPELREEFKRLMSQPDHIHWQDPLGFRNMPLTGHLVNRPFIRPEFRDMKPGKKIQIRPMRKEKGEKP